MKKIIILLAVVSSSCDKQYVCVCSYASKPGVEKTNVDMQTETTIRASKKKAGTICSNLQTTGNSTVVIYYDRGLYLSDTTTVQTTCTLK